MARIIHHWWYGRIAPQQILNGLRIFTVCKFKRFFDKNIKLNKLIPYHIGDDKGKIKHHLFWENMCYSESYQKYMCQTLKISVQLLHYSKSVGLFFSKIHPSLLHSNQICCDHILHMNCNSDHNTEAFRSRNYTSVVPLRDENLIFDNYLDTI